MGVDSFPVCVTPTGLKFDDTKLPSDVKERLWCHGYFQKEYGDLDELQKQCCGWAQIWGYMSDEYIRNWKIFLGEVLKQNPEVPKVEFHFVCGDFNIAYFIRFTRKGEFTVFNAPSGHCYFFNIEYEEYEDDEETLAYCAFDESRYMHFLQNYKTAFYPIFDKECGGAPPA